MIGNEKIITFCPKDLKSQNFLWSIKETSKTTKLDSVSALWTFTVQLKVCIILVPLGKI